MAKKGVYGALSDAEIARVRNQMSKWAKAAQAGAALGWGVKAAAKWAAKLASSAKASKAIKSVYPSTPWMVKMGAAAAKWASKIASKLRK